MKVGKKIRELRRKAELTQSELAKKIGVSTGAVGLWEVNKREPDIDILLKMSKIFDVTIDYILGNDETNTLTIIGRNGSYCKFQLSEDKIEVIAKLAETIESENKWTRLW